MVVLGSSQKPILTSLLLREALSRETVVSDIRIALLEKYIYHVVMLGNEDGNQSHGDTTRRAENRGCFIYKNVCVQKSQGLGCKEKGFCSHKQLEIPKSPNNAMEFLCRSWSASASDFLNIFSSRNILAPSDINKVEEDQEHEDDTMNSIPGMYRATIKEDNIRILTPFWFINPYIELCCSMEFNHIKTWLKGKSLKSFLRSRKEKKKEETRLRTSQLHAALSLTQLAAAIAEISRGKQDFSQVHKGMLGASGQDMGEVVASAAALITTAFAEAAESLGAQRAQVRAAVNSGMAIQAPIDMIAVTATAATCLRGAAILRSRTMSNSPASTQEMLRMDAQICIIMPSGGKFDYIPNLFCILRIR
ncbi:unnamed protein product [Fraxinus pennsylvanica]|uniref:VAN3-binding protein-like auxin canalisation domain-containing protein n=1 Tax=Fraxinus pennsylvanica TaxID=56036 RepID=A0AAD1ZLM2_9LAMI|nr:unnamed protein product [Fraxinus pennsylvanica]